MNGNANPFTLAEFNAGEEATVIAEPQNRWTEIKSEGIDTGTTKKTTISSELTGGNIGIQFEVSATFRGKASNLPLSWQMVSQLTLVNWFCLPPMEKDGNI